MDKTNSFVLTSEHQTTFDTLITTLTIVLVLGCLDFTKEFILEINASLNGLGAVLSQEDNSGEVCIKVYASGMLQPSEQSMHNYS